MTGHGLPEKPTLALGTGSPLFLAKPHSDLRQLAAPPAPLTNLDLNF